MGGFWVGGCRVLFVGVWFCIFLIVFVGCGSVFCSVGFCK